LLISSRYLVATTTVWSGASYIYTKDAVKILNHEQKQAKDEKVEKDEERK
jgi:cardiolipin synthase